MSNNFQQMLDDIYSETVDEAAVADAELAIDIATQFRALRERRGLSQRAVAELVGRTQQAISKIENPIHSGHSLSALKEVIESLDAVLDVTIVPLEDLESYRSLFPAKPALEDISVRLPSIWRPFKSAPRQWTPIASSNGTSWGWLSKSESSYTRIPPSPPSAHQIVYLKEWLAGRSPKRVRHG